MQQATYDMIAEGRAKGRCPSVARLAGLWGAKTLRSDPVSPIGDYKGDC